MAKLPGPIEDEIDELASIFGETGNPAAAWQAFALAREHGFAVPANVDAEIARFAQAVTAPLDGDRGPITSRSVAEAWGITQGRKPAPELRNYRRDLDLYFEYWRLRRTKHRKTSAGWIDVPGLSRNEAIAKLVDLHHKSPKTIEEIMTRFFKEYGDGDPLKNLASREP
ncbi:hypothetical protein [Nitrobacter winogradskyi]|uniref:Uncharacterized protein n=2 Tax=Nitrobacter winogradskyi TaxID=913 RepID=A0A4Y3WC51_NITWI|nr:hypothetical protein [Nitrobacter winogradskyi]MCP1998978.1 hypothetical protein [Nitrobacter winogradskyi]GEC16503.1 hypothetical protein NWI01_23950 [Nitrobacter winogradskyi]